MADEPNVIKEEVKDEQDILRKVFNILRENSPELVGVCLLTVIRPPQILFEGTDKTVFVNFMDYCKTMNRQPNHVRAFLCADMSARGTIDMQQRLVVNRRVKPKRFKGNILRYITEYVMCCGCKSTDTILSKENRIFFLICEKPTLFLVLHLLP
ncbi:PREDICTED: eukaryotic translation initiation factor 2 subunit beta-like [Camelina sativa]|uniref:Eukaryotic translation initiation factor 2 subunit beta-like n=1 Tax=Camelina sativa TaxID=90675 RepID=A0ABM0WAF8_CAMSA|nr:PREDICTED: eukaryotic translation initiation factor 2 subunit beta-like [Camelina sativa]